MPTAKILGLHVTGSQSAAALLDGGRLVSAIAEERLTRQKRSRAFPRQSIAVCLKEAGLSSLDTIDHIAVPWNPTLQMRSVNMSGFTGWRRYDPEWLYIVPNNLMDLYGEIDAEITTLDFGFEGKKRLAFVSHHLAHFGWAFASPFEEAAVAIIDEYGELDSISLGTIRGNRTEVKRSVPFPYSLGVFYATFTQYLGFRPNADEWKVMGASAYGDASRFQSKLTDMIRWDDGSLWLDQTYFEFANMRFAGYYSQRLIAKLGIPPRAHDAEMRQEHYDLAAACQAVFEQALFGLLRWLHAETKLPNLVMNGGCCMNSLANGKVLAQTPFRALFVPPAAADNGTSIGAALWVQHKLLADGPLFRTTISPYSGRSYTDAAIRETIEKYKLPFKTSANVVADTVDLLVSGKIVGWFQGRMEFGERALGNRSILADPRDPTMKDRINRSVKYREAFRPFAPSVLQEAAHLYFDIPDGASSDYMERVYPVRTEMRGKIPAVVHADGSGRLHTVRRESNPLYYGLIETFAAATGVPILVNTSFNTNGEPIVESPDDAIRTFYTSGLDALVIGSHLLRKP
jgi:carbamoyltransferase